jgi:hypothetical protein
MVRSEGYEIKRGAHFRGVPITRVPTYSLFKSIFIKSISLFISCWSHKGVHLGAKETLLH